MEEAERSATLGSELTRLLNECGADPEKAGALVWPLVKDELQRIAHRSLSRMRGSLVLQTTALVDDAFLKLIGSRHVDWNGRAHFYAAAASIVRRAVADWARAEQREKRGGSWHRVELEGSACEEDLGQRADVLDLEEALERLAAGHPRPARVVEMKFYAGLGVREMAEVLGVSERTVEGDWEFARTWLFREIRRGTGEAQRQGS